MQTNREVRSTAGTVENCSKQGTYCQCNGCKTRRYSAGTFIMSMAIALGVWVGYFF